MNQSITSRCWFLLATKKGLLAILLSPLWSTPDSRTQIVQLKGHNQAINAQEHLFAALCFIRGRSRCSLAITLTKFLYSCCSQVLYSAHTKIVPHLEQEITFQFSTRKSRRTMVGMNRPTWMYSLPEDAADPKGSRILARTKPTPRWYDGFSTEMLLCGKTLPGITTNGDRKGTLMMFSPYSKELSW